MKDTNPDHYKVDSADFIKYMDDPQIKGFGDWMFANGYNVAEMEQQNLFKEYEKLSQVCFKIEKYLKIADLSILIDRIEEGMVEVLQDDGRPDVMETTIKIRRL